MRRTLANRLLLSSLRVLQRRSLVPVTARLRDPTGIIVRPAPGPAQLLFSMPAIRALAAAHSTAAVVLVLSREARELPFSLPDRCDAIGIDFARFRPTGRMHRRSRSVLRQYSADLFVDFEASRDVSVMAAWAADAPVRATFDRPGLFPFFNCVVAVDQTRCRDDVERYLRLVAGLGVPTEDRSLEIDLKAAEIAKARVFLRLAGLKESEIPVVVDLPLGRDQTPFGRDLLLALLLEIDRRVSGVRFLLTRDPGLEVLVQMRQAASQEPLVVAERGLRGLSALLANCALLIAGQSDLVAVACALDLPLLLLRGSRERELLKPPSEAAVSTVIVPGRREKSWPHAPGDAAVKLLSLRARAGARAW
jgi:ADP-heptose:LPS heptosyltransferase